MSKALVPPPRAPHRLPFGSRRNRLALCLAACGLAILPAPASRAQVIELSLNVYYEDPADISSGGQWKLVGKATDFGIAGVNVFLGGINPVVNNEAPRGLVNGSNPAGLATFFNLAGSYLLAQQPAPVGAEVQSAFYGIGSVPDGDPYDVDPGYPPGSFTNLQGVPWGVDDDLVAGVNNSPWDIAATLLSGTFADGVQPGFLTGHTGLVFTTNGTSTSYGEADPATITTTIRTNFNPSTDFPDYNDDGFIDAADYVAWRKNPSAHHGDPVGHILWKQHFAESVPGASGQPSIAVPEPCAALLLGALIANLFARPKRPEPPAPEFAAEFPAQR